jgi:predicted AAA+ superfamily ATPase
VGKTTLIKLQIKELLEMQISKWNILYYAFDIHTSVQELVRILKTYFDRTSNLKDEENRCYLFLDEITSIKNWQKGIKKLWDDAYLRNCSVIVTGSHSIDMQRSTEMLPGRRGDISEDDTYDKILLPMKFSEYVSLIDSDLEDLINKNFKRESRTENFNSLLAQRIDTKFEKMFAYVSTLNQYLHDYLTTGGIPMVINEYMQKGEIPSSVYFAFFQYIIGDIHNLQHSEQIFKRLVTHIIENIGFTLSYRDIQKNIDIGSSVTVEDYINLLCNMFILTLFYKYDSTRKRGRTDKEKRIRFHDPFFFHTLNSWVQPEQSFYVTQEYLSEKKNLGQLVEGVVGDHLIRLAFYLTKKKNMFDYSNYLYYWQDQKGYEVDYILNVDNRVEVPIEVKFTNEAVKSDELNGLFNFKRITGVKNAILITEDILQSSREYIQIPASLFLLLI